MMLHRLFWSALGLVPLVASLDVEKCLSSEFLDSLPDSLQPGARDVKTMLLNSDSLHLDNKARVLNSSEVIMLASQYVPKLQALVTLASGDPDFFKGLQDSDDAQPQWPRGLQAALKCLIPDSFSNDIIKEITLEDSASPVEFALAVTKLTSLYKVFEPIRNICGTNVARFYQQQQKFGGTTFGHEIEIGGVFSFFNIILQDSSKLPHEARFLQALKLDREENRLGLERTLDVLNDHFIYMSSDLRSLDKELLTTAWLHFWFFACYPMWSNPLAATLNSSRLVAILNRFRARFLSEYIMIRLETFGGSVRPPQLDVDEKESIKRLSDAVEELRLKVEQATSAVKSFTDRDGGSNTAHFLHTITFNLSGDFHKVLLSLAKLPASATGEAALNSEMVARLVGAHQAAMQLVDLYVLVFNAAKEKLYDEKGRALFLLNLFPQKLSEISLVFAKSIMDSVEEALKLQPDSAVQPYDWKAFPLNHWWSFPPPQPETAKPPTESEVPLENVLGKRGVDPEREKDEEEQRTQRIRQEQERVREEARRREQQEEARRRREQEEAERQRQEKSTDDYWNQQQRRYR